MVRTQIKEHRLRNRLIAWLAALLVLHGCAGGLQPVETPDEFTPPPSQAAQWEELDSIRQDDWFHVLNVGSEAFDWRLRAIDSAADSIDLQTFIWELDSVGHQIRDHLLAAAERGVFVRVLVDDSFVLDADQELLDIDSHANIELKVFNVETSTAKGIFCLPDDNEVVQLEVKVVEGQPTLSQDPLNGKVSWKIAIHE